jgi:hypothetical protein
MSAHDPVPPFPQEPAFGSREAVEQAAETLRGFTPGPWRYEEHGKGLPLVVRAPDDRFASGRLVASIPAGYDASPSYAAQLWTAFPDAENNARLIAAAPDLLAEAERLRQGVEEANRWADSLQEQRDALADALEDWHRPWVGIELRGGGDLAPYAGFFIRDDDAKTSVYVSKSEWAKVLKTRELLRKAGR